MKRMKTYGPSVAKSSYDTSGLNAYGSGAPPQWLNALPTVLPETLITPVPAKTPQLTRMEKRLQPQETNYASNGNNILTFDFPNAKPIDFREGYLTFDVILTTTQVVPPDQHYERFSQGIYSCLNKVRVIFGSMEDEIQYYNRLYSHIWNSSVDNEVEATMGVDLIGIGTQAQRNAAGASTTGTKYVVPMLYGMFRQGTLPMNALSTGTNGQLLRVELTLENPLLCVETNGLNPQYQFVNLRWHYSEVSSEDGSYEREMVKMVQSGNYKIGFETWSVYQNPVLNSAVDVIVQWKGAAINYIASTLVDASTQADTLVNDKFTTWLKTLSNGASLLNYQHSVNEIWIPVEAVDTAGEAQRAFMMYLNNHGYWSIDGRNAFPAPIDIKTFNANQFIITLNLRSYCRKYIDRAEFFNNLSTSTSTSNTLLRMQFTAAPPPQTVVYHFVSNNNLLVASPNGILTKKW